MYLHGGLAIRSLVLLDEQCEYNGRIFKDDPPLCVKLQLIFLLNKTNFHCNYSLHKDNTSNKPRYLKKT